MAVYPYRKFKISLNPNSSKTQGLRVGDIVRRQYFDNQLQKNPDGSFSGQNVGMVYSLMCVLETGVDLLPAKDASGNYIIPDDFTPTTDANGDIVQQKAPWFIGALIEGDAPVAGELMDFVRITSLYDTDRSGAIYLTASDDRAPFMDVIDGIGRNESLCWPIDLAKSTQPDSETQYVLQGTIQGEYIPEDGMGHYRILHAKKINGGAQFVGLRQEFYKYVSNPNMVLISYRAKASATVRANVSLGYVNDAQTDGDVDAVYDTEWRYFFHAIVVDWSGRHLRNVKVNLGAMHTDDEVWISDFNIILLSSVSNFKDASKTRIGRLEGVIDPVFGRLDGYGGYLHKIFASGSAHISGTLTAGDENGFGSSFYAGKIHKNCFINSLGLDTLTGATVAGAEVAKSPTGAGVVLKSGAALSLIAQKKDWLFEKDSDGRNKHIGNKFTFSFWVYCKKPCVLDLTQSGKSIGALYVNVLQTHQWVRLHRTFELREPIESMANSDVILVLTPTFKTITDPIFEGGFKQNDFTGSKDKTDDTLVEDEDVFFFTSPQLEAGELATQYQATDEQLNYTDDYGAWFDRGGIGGTIQNPLLRLNYDGKGGIATRQNSPTDKPSLALNQDGSGHVAKGRISWDETGDVTFDKSVKMSWENLADDTKDELKSKSIKIQGNDTFTLLGDSTGANPTTDPADILLTLVEENFSSSSNNRKWQYLVGYQWVDFPEGKNNGKTLTIFPFNSSPDYWGDSNKLTIRCVVTIGDKEYVDTFTIRKQYITGYTLEIVSSNGTGFKNNDCDTVLTANVYYQGKLVDPAYCQAHYIFKWVKCDLVNGTYVEDTSFWTTQNIDRTAQQITLDYPLSGSDCFFCELMLSPGFPYDFPIYF